MTLSQEIFKDLIFGATNTRWWRLSRWFFHRAERVEDPETPDWPNVAEAKVYAWIGYAIHAAGCKVRRHRITKRFNRETA